MEQNKGKGSSVEELEQQKNEVLAEKQDGQQTTPPPAGPTEVSPADPAQSEPGERVQTPIETAPPEQTDGPTVRDDQPDEVQSLDLIDGDEADQLVGDEVPSEAGVNPEGFAAQPKDFPMPKENDTNG